MATNDQEKLLQEEEAAAAVDSGYAESDAVKQAAERLNQQIAQKPGAYQSRWQTQLNDTIDKIMNREKFSYDLNGDALYQQYKDQYLRGGKLAMMDTMGQAAALTGGYGNSYAQMAGQQAYQGYLQGLNDKIPELYQLALDQYNQEGQDLYNRYSLLGAQENQEYGRYRDTVSDYGTELDRLYNRYDTERSYDYGQYRDTVADSQWQAEFDEAKRRYDQEWAAAHPTSSGGGSGGSSGSGKGKGESDLDAFLDTYKSMYVNGASNAELTALNREARSSGTLTDKQVEDAVRSVNGSWQYQKQRIANGYNG